MLLDDFTGILKRVRDAGGTDAVIAGGAVRDFLLGRPMKDIDVFLRSRGNVEDERIVKTAYPKAELQFNTDPEYSIQMPEVASVWNYQEGGLFADAPVQLIFLNGPDVTLPGMLERFDFGLCRAGFDGDIVVTAAFVKDAFGMTMTLLYSPHPAHSQRRYERLIRKYPYHRLVKP